MKPRPFSFQPYSKRQQQLVSWWTDTSPYRDYDVVLADGAIRSGKTVADIDGFLTWSLCRFQGEAFILAAKSMGALKRNVLRPMFQILTAEGLPYRYVSTGADARLEIGENTYYLFGANNETSQDTLQGLTAAGYYLDDAGKMPRSFVEQADARCSVAGAKGWINCNPEGPHHYLKTEYIDKAHEKKILHLHFTLDDNLTLAEATKARYRRMYSGVFYQRNILGLWVLAQGVIYAQFNPSTMVVDELPRMSRYWVACDYGASNATTFLLFGMGASDNRLYVIDEYYHSFGENGIPKSPAQYSSDFRDWMKEHKDDSGRPIQPEWIFIDPSALGFTQQLYTDGVPGLAKAKNDVKPGIELVSSLITCNLFRVHRRCSHTLEELSVYAWDPKAQERGEDAPIKKFDHTMDPTRYVAYSMNHAWLPLIRQEASRAA